MAYESFIQFFVAADTGVVTTSPYLLNGRYRFTYAGTATTSTKIQVHKGNVALADIVEADWEDVADSDKSAVYQGVVIFGDEWVRMVKATGGVPDVWANKVREDK